MDLLDHYKGGLLGLAAGDAVGTTVEFSPRGSFPPVTDMTGGGPFRLPAGAWTDDTSLALCLAASLVEKGTFDAQDQMDRYWRWYRKGYMSSTGRCFDIGNTTWAGLQHYKDTGDPYSSDKDAWRAGNGSIMRLAPVALFYFPNPDEITCYCGESSRTTHGAPECIQACQFLGGVLYRALMGADKQAVLLGDNQGAYSSPGIKAIAGGDYFQKQESEIRGTGYVVESLEAALWCFWVTETFEEAILKAANLGDDADTTAAVCGQVAGAFFGVSGIPSMWLEKLVMRREIEDLANGLYMHNHTE